MMAQVYYCEGCPNYQKAYNLLGEVIKEEVLRVERAKVEIELKTSL